LEELKIKHYQNVLDVKSYTSNNEQGDAPNSLQNKIETVQKRLGNGMLERGQKGWYKLSASCVFTFCIEDGTIKISGMQQPLYNKEYLGPQPQ